MERLIRVAVVAAAAMAASFAVGRRPANHASPLRMTGGPMTRRISLAAVAAVLLASVLGPAAVHAGFTGGPSVRVSPNSKVEIRWIADFVSTAR